MDQPDDLRWFTALTEILGGAHLWQPGDLAGGVAAALSRLGLDGTIWLADYEQTALRAVPRPGRDTPAPLPMDGTLAGRAFVRVESIPAGDGERWWIPVVDGTERLGVLEIDASGADGTAGPGFAERCELVAGLVGHLVATLTTRGSELERVRRSRPMSTASELLWQLLPPLTASEDRAVVSAILQPCYEVGGDGFDYAFDGDVLHLVVLDAAGRGLSAGLACAVGLAAIRAARRAGRGLREQARAADAALLKEFPDFRFVTAVLAELHLRTGRMRYINAGHPPPLLLRAGRTVRDLSRGRRLPLGLGDETTEIAEESLEPADRLLMYTDGVTEARTGAGDRFGVARLADLTEQHAAAGLPAPETLRRLAHAVLEHQAGPPADDATLLLVQWSAVAALDTVPTADSPTEGNGTRS